MTVYANQCKQAQPRDNRRLSHLNCFRHLDLVVLAVAAAVESSRGSLKHQFPSAALSIGIYSKTVRDLGLDLIRTAFWKSSSLLAKLIHDPFSGNSWSFFVTGGFRHSHAIKKETRAIGIQRAPYGKSYESIIVPVHSSCKATGSILRRHRAAPSGLLSAFGISIRINRTSSSHHVSPSIH